MLRAGHADADAGIADQVRCRGHVAHVFAPADHDAVSRRTLDRVAGDDGIGLDRDTIAASVLGLLLAS